MSRNGDRLPPLDASAVERMQAGVMAAVSRQASQRRLRTGLLGGSAAVLAGALVVGGAIAAGTGRPGDDLAIGPAVSAEYSAPAATEGGDAGAPGIAAEPGERQLSDKMTGFGTEAPEAAAEDGSVTDGRSVITTGSISLRVDDVEAAAGAATAIAEGVGGFVESRWQSGETGAERAGSVTIRVPADRLGGVLEALRELGSVDSIDLADSDVTLQVRDIDARITALEASIERLRELMQQAGSVSELLEAEEQLSYRQSELESLRSQQSYLSEQVALSTITVELRSKAAPAELQSDGFAGGLLTGWNALIAALGGLITGLGVILPWVGVVVLLGLLLWGVLRLVRRRRRAAALPPLPPAPPQR